MSTVSNVQKGYIEDNLPVFYPSNDNNALKYQLIEGDLLISLTGNVGRVGVFERKFMPAALNQRVACIRIKDNNLLCKSFLFYFLNSDFFEEQCILSSKGVAQKNLSTEWLKEYVIPLPSLNEQRKIAAVLDKVSDLIAKRRQQLDKLDTLVKARFVEMFGDPHINPNGYPVCQLSDYIEFLTSGSRGWAQYCTDTGSEWFITIKNVKDCRISVNNMQPVDAPDNAEAKRTKVQEGDLLISITADLGRTGVVTKEIAEHGAYINQHLTCIRLNRDVLNPVYVAFFMESPAGKEQFASKNQSAVKAGLNFNAINSLRLLLPPMAKQIAFVEFVEQTDRAKKLCRNSLKKIEILKHSLIQKAFG